MRLCGCANTAVHPHGCGEHRTSDQCRHRLRGSSPRVWGTHGLSRKIYRDYRFIPTGVGNTLSNPRTGTPRPVHPHGCGEHPSCVTFQHPGGGSSPRVWGTRKPFKSCRVIARFIPTGVGNTFTAYLAPVVLTVHPHGCGEHVRKAMPIQAYQPVHPHGCGDHISHTHTLTKRIGSSPRVWGTPHAALPTPRTSTGSSPRVWGTHAGRYCYRHF